MNSTSGRSQSPPPDRIEREDEAGEMRSDELALLLRITNSLNSGRELAEILGTLYDEFRDVMPYDRMEYAVLDDGGYVLTTAWVRANYESKGLPPGYAYRRAEPIDRDRFRVAFLDNDLTAYAAQCADDHPVAVLAAEGIKSSLNCPLLLGDAVTGVLFFNSRQPSAYTSHHLELIQLIAGHLASILEHSRLNDQLKAQNDMLRALERSRLEFIASISHELRTPLTAVLGFASELRDRVEHFSNEEIAQFSSLIASQSAEVSGLVEDLLVITRAEAGRLDVQCDVLSVAEEVKRVYDSIPRDRPDQEVTLDLEEVEAWADPLRVRQILRNLLSNAGRYGGPHLKVQVRRSGERVEVTVADDGEGIPEHERDSVFQAYERSHRSNVRPGSIGLGLTVSRYLAEAMGGALSYERPDDESRFVLRLPVYRRSPGSTELR